jgi:hypothetical protein
VVFEDPEVADKVVAVKHTIDRREVEAKKAVPKEETPAPQAAADASQKTRKIFVGGLAPSVDEQVLRQYFEQFGAVEDAVVMYDHDNKRPRGFGFITFADEESVDKVFSHGAMQNIHDKQIEIKPAVPRDQMPPQARRGPPFFPAGRGAGGLPGMGGMGVAGFGGRVPPFGFPRQPGGLTAAAGTYGGGGARGGGAGMAASYLAQGAMPSPRGLPGGLGGYGGSPRSMGYGGGGGMAGGPLGGFSSQAAAAAAAAAAQQQQQQQQQQQRFSGAGGMGGAGGSRFAAGIAGGQFNPNMYGSLGAFGGGDPSGLVQAGTSPGAMGGMYNIGGLQQLHQPQQQQQASLNGYPGQLDMAKLGSLAGASGQGAAAAAAAAAMAAKGYSMQAGLGAGAFPAFAGGQQAFGGQPDAAAAYGGDPAAAAAAAAAAGYGGDVSHLPRTSALGTTPEFATFGAGAAGWGS